MSSNSFRFENKKVRTADINPILQKIAHFNKVKRKNKKRDKPKKEDLSRVVHQVELFSKQNLELLNNFLKLFLNHPKHTRF
jgi:hypothetical protein